MTSPPSIEVENLTKRFGAFVADDNLSFSVDAGETFGLLGPNGAGKTTLIRMLTTLLPPTSGRARVRGHDVVSEKTAVRSAIGTVSQAVTTDENLTVYENLSVQGKMHGLWGRPLAERIERRLKEVNLWERRDQIARQLSGGMRRRLEIARGVLHSPQVLFLDEPTAGLDPQSRRSIWSMLEEMTSSDASLSIILTTHAMDEADHLCDRVAIMDQGRILCEDSPEALKRGLATGERVEIEADREIAAADRERDPGARRRQLAFDRAAGDPVPGEAGGRDRPALGSDSRGAGLPGAVLDDRSGDARGRLLLLHGTRPPGSMSAPDVKRARGFKLAILGILAICQRSYVTLWRQPVLIVSTMLFPLVYLLILGNALNRQLRAIPLAVVDESANALAAECLRGAIALESGRDLLRITPVADREEALRGLRRGKYRAVWVLPFGLARQGPVPSFIGDNTDRFSFDTVEAALSEIWDRASTPGGLARAAPAVRLEAYPYLDYLTYLAPAVVCLAIFMGSMVSGGLQVIEDRMFGYHEGYLVTPISTGTLVAGHILAGSLVAALAGSMVLVGVLVITPVPRRGGRGGRRVALHDLSHVPLHLLGVVPALRAGAARERAARRVRDHQRADLFPFGRPLSRRVVPGVAARDLGRGPVDLRPQGDAGRPAARSARLLVLRPVDLPDHLHAGLRNPDKSAVPPRDLTSFQFSVISFQFSLWAREN